MCSEYRIRIGLAGLVVVVFAVSGCFLKKNNTDNNTTGNTSTGVTTAALVSSLTAISEHFTPASLDYAGGGSSLLGGKTSLVNAQSQDPCQGYDLFGCQPVLLRIYISIAKQFFDITKLLVSETGTHLGSIADGASGSVVDSGNTISYSKTSSLQYKILVNGPSGPFSYVDVSGTNTTIKMNFDNMPATPGEDNPGGSMQASVSYTDENTWSIALLIAGMACQANDVRAPRSIWVLISKAEGLWKGKAIIYNPVWGHQNPTCSTTEADNISMNFYTDFVGNDLAAKASVYLMTRNISDLSSIATYDMNKLCTNYPTLCSNVSGGNPPDLSQYANPFCNPASTDVALWGNTCTGVSSAVGSAAFGPTSDWITPSNFWQLSVTLPSYL